MRRTIPALALALVAAACSGSDDGGAAPDATGVEVDGDCVVVDMAVSSEKIALLTDLAETFNEQGNEVDGQCVAVSPRSKASGAAAELLVAGWPDPEVNGPRPVIWSPAASGWGAIVNQRLADRGEPAVAPTGTPFMRTPLVIAMPQPMAEALGWPDTPIGFADIVALANDPDGWAKYGHPEWGPFRLGKTNPNFSTSGLNFTIAEYYAATGKTRDLTVEDLDRPDVEEFARSVESAVVHYGDITMTFLNNWFRADARGTALTYASAVAVEEKSVIDYNLGNPDGELSPGETPRPPKVPLVAIYPEEGTLYSDNPFIVLDAEWVTPAQREAAALFEAFVQEPANQQRVLEFGFRPGNTQVALGDPVVPANGVDPDQPQNVLEVPDPTVLVRVLDRWAEHRKPARVVLLMDVSGSMGDPGAAGSSATKLELAQQAAVAALGSFKAEDEVGLWVFSTGLPDGTDGLWAERVAPTPMAEGQLGRLQGAIEGLFPVEGTPLYAATQAAAEAVRAEYDPTRINAVVLLTDGVNDDGEPGDDDEQLSELIATLRGGETGDPVRVFPIAYGEDADTATLRRIAEASNAALYQASNPATIDQVFTAVVSNF